MATIIQWKIDELRRNTGLVGEDFIYDASVLLSDYADQLTDKDLAALAESSGIDADGNYRIK
mgnify:CR=1 FL=1